ncbi:MAG: hypothetical protein ABIG84_04955 [archaeon]
MADTYKTLKIKQDIHARLLTYLSREQLRNGGQRITICDVMTKLLDIAEDKKKN